MEGRVISGRGDERWRGAALDSRAVTGGELFFAMPGERTDGHLFVGQALARGAAAAVVQRRVEIPPTSAAIEVDDSLAALHRLTRQVRDRIPRRLVAITGSIGKTTTKEILTTLLGRRYRVACNPGNLNNLLGFPIALLGIAEDTEWMVAEMGMSTPGELARLSRLGRPDVALFTNIRPVHLEFFGSLEAIARAKAELLEGLAPGGLVVANRDDDRIVGIVERHAGPLVWFGIEKDAEFRVADVRPCREGLGSRFRFVAGGESFDIRLPLHGGYNVANFLAAAACACSLGVAAADVAELARLVQGPPNRGVVHVEGEGRVIVDDSYNSSPAALSESLRSAAELAGARHWAVLGDMLELGEAAARLHRQAGREAAELGFSPIFGVGELARELVAAARDAGAEIRWFEHAAAAAEAARGELRSEDVALVKGSRGVGLEVVVSALLQAARGGN